MWQHKNVNCPFVASRHCEEERRSNPVKQDLSLDCFVPRSDAKRQLDLSENQRINLQRRKKDSPLPPGKELERLSWGVVVDDRADMGTKLCQVEMRQDKGL